MGLQHSPKIVTDGLVFAFDMNNRFKSWVGRKNLAKTAGGVADWVVGSLDGTVSVSTVTANEVYNITCTVSGGFRFYFNLANLINGNTYTVSFKFRYLNAAADSFFMSDWCDTAVTTTITPLGNNDYYYTATGTRATYDSTYKFMDGYLAAGQAIRIWDFQLEEGSVATEYSSVFLSASGQIRDLTNTCTSSDNVVAYNPDGSFSFNGGNTYVRWNNNTALDTQTPSVDVWVKTNATTQNGFFFEKGLVNSQYSLFQEGANITWRQNYFGVGINSLTVPAATYMNTTNWFNIVGTYSSGDRRIYINGALVASDAKTGTLSVNSGGMYMGEYGGGSYKYNGQISSVRVYTRALSFEEVLRNFNAQKSRYGY